jgi:hypothetical protein
MATGTPRHTWTDNATAITAAKLNELEQDTADALATSLAAETALPGKAASTHTHGVTDLTATGTRDATTYLRGDNTWATPAGGGGGTYTDEQAQDAAAALLAGQTGKVSATYNDASNTVALDLSATGTANSSTFLRGDNTWATPSGTFARKVAFDVRDFGAVGNNAAVDGPALTAALAAADAQGGGMVVVPKAPSGVAYLTNTQLRVDTKVVLTGDTRECLIRAGSSFPINTPLVRIGDGVRYSHGSRIENLTLDCNNVAGSTGVYTVDANELSGIENILITGFKLHGFHAEVGNAIIPGNLFIRNVEFYAGSGATYAIFLDSIACSNTIETVTTGVTGSLSAGIRLYRVSATVLNHHAEASTDGLSCQESSVMAIGTTGHNTVTNLIHLTGGYVQASFYNLATTGATNFIVDDPNQVTIPYTATPSQTLQSYSAGRDYIGGGYFHPLGADSIGVTGKLVMDAGWSVQADGTWNGGTFRLGAYRLWVDSTGDLRIKNGAPTSDTDGTVVGTQT